jgi:NAD(P)-dependent dehydrogenase (short-subunit alcohol dehydrogenase family)
MSKIQGATVLLTRASGGIGRAFVDELHGRDVAKVYAGLRSLDGQAFPNDPRLELILLDVTDPASIDAAAKKAADVTRRANKDGRAAFQDRSGGPAGYARLAGSPGRLIFTHQQGPK